MSGQAITGIGEGDHEAAAAKRRGLWHMAQQSIGRPNQTNAVAGSHIALGDMLNGSVPTPRC